MKSSLYNMLWLMGKDFIKSNGGGRRKQEIRKQGKNPLFVNSNSINSANTQLKYNNPLTNMISMKFLGGSLFFIKKKKKKAM